MIVRGVQGVLLLACALILLACSSPASREGMKPASLPVGKQYPYDVSVQTTGGAETGALDSSNISNADFKAAIESAIIENRLFKGIVQGSDGSDYELNVSIISLSKPSIGFTFTVEMETVWSLIKTDDRRVVLRKGIISTGVATTHDATVAVARLRLAVEAAARDNIAQGLRAIADIRL